MTVKILQGNSADVLRTLPGGLAQICVTSPPYYGLRDYGVDGQIGLEKTPEEYVNNLVEVFREVRRVLKDDGTLWLNLGDSYVSNTGDRNKVGGFQANPSKDRLLAESAMSFNKKSGSLKSKDLIGIPWMVAFALRADGWYLRSDIIWHKPNPMPESVTDRPTKAHEYIFLLTKSPRYYYDAKAIEEDAVSTPVGKTGIKFGGNTGEQTGNPTYSGNEYVSTGKRNKRTVWYCPTRPYPGAHFATYPPSLIEPCILAGTSEKGECPVCGKAYERMTERTNESNWEFRKEMGAVGGSKKGGNKQQIGSGWSHDLPAKETTTTGWQPTCQCGSVPTPQIVLDPFSGSGTTGAVAVGRGRSYIGIELNPEYIELSKQRIGPIYFKENK